VETHSYDAIVVGTGITGGWAAKELCERGLKTLVLERGRDVPHGTGYPTVDKAPWELPYADRLSLEDKRRQPIQSLNDWAVSQATKHWFVDDLEHPYVQEKPFQWTRGYHVGGRSLMWARLCYRWSALDFEANAEDGFGVDWPIRYPELAPWYDYVEEFIGVSGQAEGIEHWPDGKYLPPMELNCLELSVKEKLKQKFDRTLTVGRVANLTRPHQGRGQCLYRDQCIRGCPQGAYFSSNSSTLPAAAKTGNMTLRPHSIVSELIYDDKQGKATGVRVIDALTKQTHEFSARIIFLNASTLASTAILLNSKSRRFPNGFGNDSGELGHNLMDHHFAGAWGRSEEFANRQPQGQRPNDICVPRFRNVKEKSKDYVRGFYYGGRAGRSGWWRSLWDPSLAGEKLKKTLAEPGSWNMSLQAFGECLPRHENRVYLKPDQLDGWGLPLLAVSCEFGENEAKMTADMKASGLEMLEAAGLKDAASFGGDTTPGAIIHEMGTARMGRDPKTSVLNAHNQVHAARNVFVTDGSCMASSACQNPSLTYMALTARAAAYAVSELKKLNL
jgi:choline dehydrogenase-like flavoprotein